MALTVDRVALAPDLSISRVLTGLWQIADMERDGRALDPEPTARALRPYVDAGFTSFDMADHYGSAEIVASHLREGAGAAHPVQLLTKWVPKPGPLTLGDVRAAVERSLQRLRTPRIDLLQFHAWSYADPSWIDGLRHLQALKSEGMIAHIGLTNVDAAHLNMVLASGIEVISNQVCFSLLDRRAAGALSDVCRARGVKLLAYGTVAGGWLSNRWLGQPEPDWERSGTWSQMKYGRFIRVAGGWDALQRVLRAADRGRSAARRVDRQRGLSLHPRAAGRGRRHHRRPAWRARAHRRQPPRLFLRAERRGSRGVAGGARDAQPDSRRLRRRVPQAAVSDGLRRSESSRGVVPGALRGAAPRRRAPAVPERDALGEHGRVLPGDAARHAG